jgi:hypothetical protein
MTWRESKPMSMLLLSVAGIDRFLRGKWSTTTTDRRRCILPVSSAAACHRASASCGFETAGSMMSCRTPVLAASSTA